AKVEEETLTQAKNKTTNIFDRAGAQFVWHDGFAYAAERRKLQIPPPEDLATLVVKLQPDSEAARYGVRSACGGVGLESGVIIFVRKSMQRGWAMSLLMNSGTSCWVRMPTPLQG